MSKTKYPIFFGAKFKEFFLFILLALFFWILTKFSKTYENIITLKLAYTNIPHDKILSDSNPSNLDVKMTLNGFEYLYYKLNKPHIDIDVQKGEIINKYERHFSSSKYLSIIDQQLYYGSGILPVSFNTLIVKLDENAIKRIAVKSNIKINYAPGFFNLSEISLQPDSITLSGPKALIDKITFISTKELIIKQANKNQTGLLDINKTKLNKLLVIKPLKIKYEIPIAEFTEATQTLNIEVINLPKDIKIKLFPKTIKLTYKVILSEYNKISDLNFRVVCDFEKRQEDNDFLFPELIEKPSSIRNPKFENSKIQFVVIK